MDRTAGSAGSSAWILDGSQSQVVDAEVEVLAAETAQKQIVDQTEDGSVQADPQRQRDERKQSKSGRLEQLPESETKISHHKIDTNIKMRPSAQSDSN